MNSQHVETAANAEIFVPVPQQQEMPLAIVRGPPVLQMPQDLYIPADALEVILEAFEGPLDLLLYLIRRQNLDILDIPIAEITRQYIDYIGLMKDMKLELAAADLVRRLQEYERFKKAAEDIEALPRLERDTAVAHADSGEHKIIRLPPPVELRELLLALKDVMRRAELSGHHN